MIRKYHNYMLQTYPWYREDEPHNNHETPGRQTKQSNQLSLPHQDGCKTRTDIKYCTTNHRTITDSHNGSYNNQPQQKHHLRMDRISNGGSNAFYWYQIFALDSAVVEVHEMFSSPGSLLIIAMYHHGETP